MYQDDDDMWENLLTLVVQDFADGQKHGVELPGEGICYPVILGNKGDWSYLVPCFGVLAKCWVYILGCKCATNALLRPTLPIPSHSLAGSKVTSARLERSYRRAPRGANQGKEPPGGICHLCMAGTDGPFLEWENQHLIP